VDYCNRLCAMDDRLPSRRFLESWNLALKRETSWCKSFKYMLEPLGIVFLEHPQAIKADFIFELRDIFIQYEDI